MPYDPMTTPVGPAQETSKTPEKAGEMDTVLVTYERHGHARNQVELRKTPHLGRFTKRVFEGPANLPCPPKFF